jgi:hypothetical protein
METYILFYSNYCANCKEFIQSLYKSPFFEKFKKVCVDNNTNIPNEITSIPSIIVPRMAKVLTGTEAFHWLRGMNQIYLQEQEKQVNQDASSKAKTGAVPPEGNTGDPTNLNYAMGAVTAYSGTMDGFSDSFSFLGNDSPMEHQFEFLGKGNGKIHTPQEDGVDPRSQMTSGGGSEKKGAMDKDYERMLAARATDTPKPVQRQ